MFERQRVDEPFNKLYKLIVLFFYLMFNIPRRFAGIKRFEQVLSVLAKHELGFFLERAGLKKKTFFAKKKTARPVELRMMFEELGASFVKLGQLLSLRPDLIPKEYCDELAKLQDDCEPIPYNEVEHVIKSELKMPINKLFKSFEKKPIASASIGQVHVASLKNGKKVAVKVMRPGITALMETDLEILEYLARLFKHHVKQSLVDPEEIFDEFKRYSEDELDYMKEAHIIKIFNNNFKGDEKVKIPLVYERLTTKRVLTMQFIEGVEIRKLISHPGNYPRIDKKKLSQLIVNSVMKQIFIDGLFHADPHPGNILFNRGRIGFIDFGIVGKIDDEMKEKLGFLFISLLTRDTDSIVKAFISLNMVDEDVDADALKKEIIETLGEYYDASLEKVDMVQLFVNSLAIARKHNIKLSRDFVLLAKTLLTLQGLSIELNPDFNLVRATHPFLVKLIKKKSSASEVIKGFAKETKILAEFVHALPGESKKVFKTVEKADVALDSINNDIRGLTREIRTESWRLIMALLVGAFVIGASLTYNTDSFMAKAFIVLAGIILFYLLFTVFRDNLRKNRLS